MPKVSKCSSRRFPGEYESAKVTKNCAYCKNHNELYPEKNHKQDCPYNNEEHYLNCRPCLQNHKKSENVKRWREKKNILLNGQNEIESESMKDILSDLVNETFKDMDKGLLDEIYQYINAPESKFNNDEKMEVDEFSDTTTNNQSSITDLLTVIESLGLTFAILPFDYPNNILNIETVNDLRSAIEANIDEIPENEQLPKFISSIYESGYWRVTCADEYSRNWFINLVFNITLTISNEVVPIKIMAINQIPKHFFSVNIPEKPLEITKILRMIHKQNYGLDTSRWEIIREDEYLDGFSVIFEIDPLSYKLIINNNCILNYGMGQLEVNIVDKK